MRRLFFTLALGLLGTVAFSQAPADSEVGFRHEVKVNLCTTIIAHCPELSYEYRFTENTTAGGRLIFSFAEDDLYLPLRGCYATGMPYFRWYFPRMSTSYPFLDPIGSGFFVEVNLALACYRTNEDSTVSSATSKSEPESPWLFGTGIGAGYRWVTRKGWSAEIFGVVGRNVIPNASHEAYGTTGLTIGYTF